MIFHTIEACPICGSTIVESLQSERTTRSPQSSCSTCIKERLADVRAAGFPRATVACVAVAGEQKLAGFRVGERIEADVWRGGVERDSVVRGAKVVTKTGYVAQISVIAERGSLYLRFDDGGCQVADVAALDGASPGYPCVAIRRERETITVPVEA